MRSLARRGAVVVAAALAAATLTTPAASGAPVIVPAEDAGTIEMWGAAGAGNTPAPVRGHFGKAAYVAVERGGYEDGLTLGIRANGAVDVVQVADTASSLAAVPAELAANAAGVDLSTNNAVGWDRTGKAYAWGSRPVSLTNVASTQVTQIATTGPTAVAVAADGTVKALGSVALPAVLTSTSEPGFVRTTKVVVASGSIGVALRQDGTLVGWGATVPTGVNDATNIRDVAMSGNTVAAVTSDGTLLQWGAGASLPSGDDFRSVAANDFALAALDDAGRVSAWAARAGDVANRSVDVPTELRARTFAGISGSARQFVGIVTGAPTGAEVAQTAPAGVSGAAQEGRTLTAVPATFTGSPMISHAWLADGDLIDGQGGATLQLDGNLVGKAISYRSTASSGGVTVTSTSDPTAPVTASDVLTVTSQGRIDGVMQVGRTLTATPATFSDPTAELSYQWLRESRPVEGATGLTFTLRPEDVRSGSISFVTTATLGDVVIRDTAQRNGPVEPAVPLAVSSKGKITGTPRVGQTLTGTAAKFNDASATVTRQWLVGGQPVVGATGATFTPTAAHVGKPVSLRSTATRGTDTLTDTSAATANVAPATVPKASTSVAVSGATTAAYGSTVRWTVTVRGGSPAGGTVTVAGSGVNVRAAVSRGRAVVTLPRTLAPASRTLRVTYSGDGTHLASSRNLGLRVVKANVSAAAKVTKKPTSRKAGKVRVTVRGAGPVRAGGRVTVTVQKGSKRYTVRGNVRSNGTVDLTLRKLKKGTWTVKAVYAGDARYNARAAGAVRVKVSK